MRKEFYIHWYLYMCISETKTWMNDMKEQQKTRSAADSPAYTVEDVAAKINALDREVKYLLNKAKTWKPKKPKVTILDSNTTKASNDTKTSEKEGESENTASSDKENVGEDNESASQDGQAETTLETPGKCGKEHKVIYYVYINDYSAMFILTLSNALCTQ